jgi:hypothetical protein
LALIEAAAPPGLAFDPEKSRLISIPSSARSRAQANAGGRKRIEQEEMLWSSSQVKPPKRQAEVGQPAAAMEWLATLPFASQSDYAKRPSLMVLHCMESQSLQTEAAGWLQNSAF